ncbi:hypothetical protein ABZ547_05940 [Streptomyces sparsogenes]|uniref:hypothetical protein n=1 Tax=Streptomyces sparsogenes TaxID=67365 RepID=UPI0033E2A790
MYKARFGDRGSGRPVSPVPLCVLLLAQPCRIRRRLRSAGGGRGGGDLFGLTVLFLSSSCASDLSATAQLPDQFPCLSAAARIGGGPSHLFDRSSALRTPRELLDAFDNSSHDAPSIVVLCFF